METTLRMPSAYRAIDAGTSHSRRMHGTLFVIALFAAVFAKTNVASGVSLGDLLLLGVGLVFICLALIEPHAIRVDISVVLQLVLIFGALVGAAFQLSCSTSPFLVSEFVASFSKLLFYCFSALAVGVCIRALSIQAVGTLVSAVLALNAVIGIYVLVGMTSGVVPYEFLWFGQDAPASNAIFASNENLIRMRGLFSEPSTFGAFQTLGLSYLLLSPAIRPRGWIVAITVGSIILSFSLTAYGMLGVLLLAYVTGRGNHRAVLRTVGILVCMVVVALVASEQFVQTIILRLASVAAGTDVSAVGRIIATWELPLKVITTSPFFGTGLGNLDVAFLQIGSMLQFERMLVESPQGWNVIAYVLGSLGLVGLFSYLALSIELVRRSASGGAVFIAYMFTTGALLEPTFWVFYALFRYMRPFQGDSVTGQFGVRA